MNISYLDLIKQKADEFMIFKVRPTNWKQCGSRELLMWTVDVTREFLASVSPDTPTMLRLLPSLHLYLSHLRAVRLRLNLPDA